MRLDKFIAENTGLTRSQAAKALKGGLVTVNGEIVNDETTHCWAFGC